nr:hypothetical protein [Streptococcus anginosus]
SQARSLERAARIVTEVRAVVQACHDARPQGDEETGQGRVDAEELLWAAWQASGCAEQWRQVSLGGDTGSGEDGVLAEA